MTTSNRPKLELSYGLNQEQLIGALSIQLVFVASSLILGLTCRLCRPGLEISETLGGV